jgi:hypothetical protein
MPILNFKEIPEPHLGSGLQDTFELFGRDFLEQLGLKVVEGPGRGADGGKDLIVEEARNGAMGASTIRWLVSCKHLAHSGRSVAANKDESNILDRVLAAGCKGFLGFYSTLPSSGLTTLLNQLQQQNKIETQVFDHEAIERIALSTPAGRHLAERYFPESAKKMKPVPAKLYEEMPEIRCENCGKNLLDPPSGIFVLWNADRQSHSGFSPDHYLEMHFSCKGDCDEEVSRKIRARHRPRLVLDGWDDIPDMCTPVVFITKVMAVLNGLNAAERYEPEAFQKLKHLFIATFPHVSRHMNDADKDLIKRLLQIPSYVGGMG